MQFVAPLVPGRLVQRYKRFLADIETEEGRVTVHCPNPGAMLGLNAPGARVLLSRSTNPARKLPLTWELVEADLPGGPQWVGINTLRPNALVAEAFRAGIITALAGHDTLKPEVRYAQASRVDFLASGAEGGPCHVEVKNCHLMRQAGLAEFPDCKAARSARHMRDLAQVVAEGGRALVVIVVQMHAEAFDVARDIDPVFDRAFREARAAGVEVRAYRCAVGPEGVAVSDAIPVITPA
ncbi:DNA/RNA nuclease SfsA [Methylobacterium mesophilicum SR1.6/6]|uniref:Sugar fermentation stimulation protein homolog n=1 Tax=Methylobacterium mesophilicum SR1.6/6 TaxID=908290 RepID=A0A6B9FPP2_9HYPH|nr:DNA/RNA nuclease SfsA [Methylobacterium mesophilicum]QGY03829.1 DNA/RNA nuclease SfsA [Methylobacterium mesophilicum SR1.6/6]